MKCQCTGDDSGSGNTDLLFVILLLLLQMCYQRVEFFCLFYCSHHSYHTSPASVGFNTQFVSHTFFWKDSERDSFKNVLCIWRSRKL